MSVVKEKQVHDRGCFSLGVPSVIQGNWRARVDEAQQRHFQPYRALQECDVTLYWNRNRTVRPRNGVCKQSFGYLKI